MPFMDFTVTDEVWYTAADSFEIPYSDMQVIFGEMMFPMGGTLTVVNIPEGATWKWNKQSAMGPDQDVWIAPDSNMYHWLTSAVNIAFDAWIDTRRCKQTDTDLFMWFGDSSGFGGSGTPFKVAKVNIVAPGPNPPVNMTPLAIDEVYYMTTKLWPSSRWAPTHKELGTGYYFETISYGNTFHFFFVVDQHQNPVSGSLIWNTSIRNLVASYRGNSPDGMTGVWRLQDPSNSRYWVDIDYSTQKLNFPVKVLMWNGDGQDLTNPAPGYNAGETRAYIVPGTTP